MFHVGQVVYTIGSDKNDLRTVIEGTIAEVGNNHVWLCIPWRCTKYHSREKQQIFETREAAEYELDLLNETIIRRLSHHK